MHRYGALLFSLLLPACAFAQGENSDPFESFNRHMYAFNEGIDKVIIKPVATVYQTILPSFVRTRVTNFFNNIDLIPTVINDGLQGNTYNLGRDTWRFVINTTIGIGGLWDVATKINLPPHHEDFGLTLGKWGYQNSTYLVLPLLGPSTVRDTVGIPADYFSSPYAYMDDDTAYPLMGLDLVNSRANLLNYDNVLKQAFDPYVAVRNGYLQRRDAKIKAN